MPLAPVLLLALLCLLPLTQGLRAAQRRADDVLVNGTHGDPGVYPVSTSGAVAGWRFMPDITAIAGATLDTTSLTVGSQGATLTHYITTQYSPSKIKRAVVMVHGEDRPSWNMQIYTTRALQRAAEGGDVSEDEVVILSPQFFVDDDRGAFPVSANGTPTTNTMIWNAKTKGWGQGDLSTNPESSDVGSFDALDAVLAFFHDTTRFPALTQVVLGGFSMGGQLVQRYSVFRSDTSEDDRTHYWVSSPATYVYLNASRPAATSACQGYDNYKYGLQGVLPAYLQRGQGRLPGSMAALERRYLSRTLNFLVGTDDYGVGDPRCAAQVQGVNHVSRLFNWVTYVMPYLSGGTGGGLPSTTTVDYVVGVGHDPYAIIDSDPGIQRLFLDDYGGPGQAARAPASNGDVSGQPSTGDLTKTKSSVGALSPLAALPLTLLVSLCCAAGLTAL